MAAAAEVGEWAAATGTVAGILAGRVVIITAGEITGAVGIGNGAFRAASQGAAPLNARLGAFLPVKRGSSDECR
jgi:hypothetical protein